jgi:hypothetical protein
MVTVHAVERRAREAAPRAASMAMGLRLTYVRWQCQPTVTLHLQDTGAQPNNAL